MTEIEDWDSGTRPNKDKVRTLVMQHFSTWRPSRLGLGLPAQEGLCIQEGLRQNAYNRDTVYVAVEKKLAIREPIRSFLSGNFEKAHLHPGDVETLDLDQLTTYYKTKLDTVYLDFCGPLKDSRVLYLQHLIDNCALMGRLAFTFMRNYRGTKSTILKRAIDSPSFRNRCSGHDKPVTILSHADDSHTQETIAVLMAALDNSCAYDFGAVYADTSAGMITIGVTKVRERTHTNSFLTRGVKVMPKVKQFNKSDSIFTIDKVSPIVQITELFKLNSPLLANVAATKYVKKIAKETSKPAQDIANALMRRLKRQGLAQDWKYEELP